MKQVFEKYRVWVLCEDRRQYDFIRGFLMSQGVSGNRKFELYADLPEGLGSGEQHVRKYFYDALRSHARSKENKFLVIALDVDTKESKDILQLLEKIVQESDGEGIKDSDKLFLVMPKRNIETWFEWFEAIMTCNDSVNETTDYKHKHRNAKPKTFGENFSKIYMDYLSKNDKATCDLALPSLQLACNDFGKLCELLEKEG